MCHSTQSRPPAPPVVLPTEHHQPLALESDGGVRSVAYEAFPASASTRGVVILPDVRGAHDYYRDLAVRFAEAGLNAMVVDYFGHVTDDDGRDDDFDWQSRLPQVTSASVEPVVAAAVARLQESGVTDVFTVGFCFGGSQSWLLAASSVPVAGVIGFYGQPDVVQSSVDLDTLNRPMLLLVAGADVATSPERSEQFDRDLTAAGATHQQVVYPGAPHSFFDRSATDWQDACHDAWQQILGFIARNSTTDIGSDGPRSRASAYAVLDETLPELSGYAREFAHATITARPGLAKRDRELIILGALIAQGGVERQLRAHADAALAAGVTRDELAETVLQTLPYAGFPRTINAALAMADQLRSVEVPT